jgi:hypothetical protein
MIDPTISLAFSIYSNKGVYALLVGSGVSRSAGIPTGWEIILDLIRKLARLENEDCEPDPAAWYKTKFGEDPDYSKILDSIAKSPSERNQLLKIYFEPIEQEREHGIKLPTAAHKAIADLVFRGYFRIIITTNFDRLIEKALEEIGITPTVISTTDALKGALPLTHTSCTIIKVNGDYLDIRIKNTPSELAKYDAELDSSLDRIFDDYGLIVCGWSAEWDTALRGALERCQNHRFTTYWTSRGEIKKDITKKLIELRRAQEIPIKDSDSFFKELDEKVLALRDISVPHPLSAKIAVASLKRYIVDERNKILLHDLVINETEKLFVELSDNNFPIDAGKYPFSQESLVNRLHKYETLTQTLQAILINGCFWGGEINEELWVKCIERISNTSKDSNGIEVWLRLRLYPALLLIYSGGMASIYAGKYETLNNLLSKVKVFDVEEQKYESILLITYKIISENIWKELPRMKDLWTPASEYLYKYFRDPFRDIIPDENNYEKCFDKFECFLALIHADMIFKQGKEPWGPIGRFGWYYRRRPNENIMNEIGKEAKEIRENWPPFKAGLFEKNVGRVLTLMGKIKDQINKKGWM